MGKRQILRPWVSASSSVLVLFQVASGLINLLATEQIISMHPIIQACVMFGRGEYQTGIIIELVAAKSFDPKDLSKLAEFRNEI